MAENPPFHDFYRAANGGRPPFPWQQRLADRLAGGGGWPAEIGVPTGLGKTACLDIAIWLLATEATKPPSQRSAPTRIWWLVNRRLLVDATTDHAERIARLLADPSSQLALEERTWESSELAALEAVAQRLQSLAARPDSRPLEVIRLRGAVASSRPTDPSQPAVILSTLPMYGSRLLFRGYGSSRSMRPIDAALAGIDSLVLIDEAHLAGHLVRLFAPLAECDPTEAAALPGPRSRPTVVPLTATGEPRSDRFDIDEADRENPVVHQRLATPKLLRVDEHAVGADTAKALAAAALRMLDETGSPAAAIVFANTPKVARAVFSELEKAKLGADLVLLTGRSREREAAAARALVLDPQSGAPAQAQRPARSRHLVVVATQTLEVGADLDFDLLVTEACGVRALTQRLGRLNRLGQLPQATAVYVHVPPKPHKNQEPGWPVYGDEPIDVLKRLRAAGSPLDLCPAKIAGLLGPPGDDPGRAPEAFPALLWEWAKTSAPPAGEAPVEPFFSGLTQPDRTGSIAWRAYVPSEGERLWPRLREAETIDLPLEELRTVLAERDTIHRVAPDRVSLEQVRPPQIRPGDTVVLPADAGFIDKHGWSPASTDPAVDVAVLRDGLPLDAEAIRRFCGLSAKRLVDSIVYPADDDDSGPLEAVMTLLGLLADLQPHGVEAAEWHAFLEGLASEPEMPVHEVPRLARAVPNEALADELDELSLLHRCAIELRAHGAGVGARAKAVAEAIGITRPLVAVIERAARFHDVGKADARFQQWLDPRGSEPVLVAKSKRSRRMWMRDRIAAGWPEGGRHEALSGRLVSRWLDDNPIDAADQDLLMHLVISHHGWGRPLILPVVDSGGSAVAFELDGCPVEAESDLSTIDWDQPARFARLCRRHGTWGLALLEAVVRQSDHAVSAGGWAGGVEVD